uniref:Uncharacterized protein n=1 Tax=Timema bartmani TaxID=61472 RepID=A0A7R9EXA0_9NEOP|nr:unnamed protein product [Timema bartmani]
MTNLSQLKALNSATTDLLTLEDGGKVQVEEGFGNQIDLCRDGALNLGPSVQQSDTLPLDCQVTPEPNQTTFNYAHRPPSTTKPLQFAMNAEDEVDINGTANGIITEPINDNINKDSDCEKHFNLEVVGTRPKVRHLICNIPNGLDSNLSEDSAKINNNGEVINPIASTSVVFEAQL